MVRTGTPVRWDSSPIVSSRCVARSSMASTVPVPVTGDSSRFSGPACDARHTSDTARPSHRFAVRRPWLVERAATGESGHEHDLAAQVAALALPVRVGGALERELLPHEDAQLARRGQGDELGQARAGAPGAQGPDAEPVGGGLVDDGADPLRVA